MAQSLQTSRRVRKNFGKIKLVASMPNLIEIQKNSYEENFLQLGVPESERKDKGLQSVLRSIFPIKDPSNSATLEFVKYNFDAPKYDVEECLQRGLSFVAPLKVTLRLTVWEIDEATEAKEIKGIKEQQVYMGEIPLMTNTGTFIINGTERVVVSQMHRSPGVFFYHDDGKTHSSGKFLYSARIIPYRGSWLDFEFDAKDTVFFRIDRKRKLPVTTLLMALGMSPSEILTTYYSTITYELKKKSWVADFQPETLSIYRLNYDLINAETNEVVLEAGQKITPRLAKRFVEAGLRKIIVPNYTLLGTYLGSDLVDKSSGEILAKIGTQITEDMLAAIDSAGIKSLSVLKVPTQGDAYIRYFICR